MYGPIALLIQSTNPGNGAILWSIKLSIKIIVSAGIVVNQTKVFVEIIRNLIAIK